MTIASEITNYANGLSDAYDAVNDMQGLIPTDKNMNNLDTAIRTIPQSFGPTYTAGTGIDITNDVISIDDTVVAEISDLPTKTSDLQNDGSDGTSPYVEANELATVATSGDYTDLINTPTIPTVNDSTITIQKNGAAVDSFTTNAASNKTINITVPTTAADVSALPASTKYGATFELSINSTTYVVTATLKDQDGNTLGTAQTIDLPLESVVVSGSYDSQTKEVVLTLQNGSSIRFSVADLVSGLQPTLTAGSNITIDSTTNTISATDTTYSNFTGATASTAGSNGLVPAPASGDQEKVLHGDGTWKDSTARLVEMAYGESNAWAKFIAAYQAGSIVYCRASSNSNPATGSQTRKAFMAYVSNETNPTSVEFQYVRSQSSKTDSQQCDQVFVYKLTNASGGTWTVETRNMAPKINVSGPITKTFTTGANATITIGADTMTGATSSAAGTAGVVPAPAAGDQDKVLSGAGTWVTQSSGTTYTAGNHIDITSDVISAEGYIWGDTLTSATTPTGTVTSGMIADGTITSADIATGVVPVITMTDTDPGEGSPLAANHFVAVYGDDPVSRNYSTSETLTGAAWIDGKPIYRKVFTGTTTNTANQDLYTTLWANSGIDSLINFGGYCIYGTNGQNMIPAFDDGNISTVYLQTNSKNLMYRLKKSDAFTDRPYKIWVEYTKSS